MNPMFEQLLLSDGFPNLKKGLNACYPDTLCRLLRAPPNFVIAHCIQELMAFIRQPFWTPVLAVHRCEVLGFNETGLV